MAHLGRCRGCLIKSLALTLLLWLVWAGLLLGGFAGRSLEALVALVLAVAASLLASGHLLVIAWRREWPP